MHILLEFDVWKSDDARWKATPAVSRFVDNTDAPYTFSEHVQRLEAISARDAVRCARKAYNH